MQTDDVLSVRVTYEYVDGAHFFVSDDKMATGLCVAHKNLKTAFNEVAPVLEMLFKENHGMDVKFTPRVKYLEFKTQITKSWPDIDKAKISTDQVMPAGRIEWKMAA